MSLLSDIDEEVFIDKIKNYPAIYNDQHSDYTNRCKKEELWQELAEFMDKPVAICKRKWDVLRANFRRAHRIERSGIGKKTWRYYKKMIFLIPFTRTEEATDQLKQEQSLRIEPEAIFKETEEVPEEKNSIEKSNANNQFFTSMAMTINTFPIEHQIRIKMMLLQQVSEVQLLMENLPPPDYPINPFTD
ncbi:uncharacterized protein LOC108915823 [Anoplophora glabripennis]|uniref:uncharacterized protein LOC108915823 n=1 Tax=Anoplophora glabripennis TaxID=217634 RepID=UPI0008753960|nr:uncharacterized protein LOC108915823 [Anoplophora glabripennis]